MTQLIIADDHKMIAEGIASLLHDVPDINIVYTAANGEEVISFLNNNEADLVLMDINMPKMDGLQTTEVIKERFEKVKVLIISMHNKEGYVKGAVEAGADGYILKNTGKKELLLAMEYIMDGKTYYAQEVTQTLVKKMRLTGETEGIDLSDREKEILELLSDGLTSSEIADKIALGISTVQTYRRNLLHKFEAKNVSELIKKSVSEGYVR